jgi:hypothetical protein
MKTPDAGRRKAAVFGHGVTAAVTPWFSILYYAYSAATVKYPARNVWARGGLSQKARRNTLTGEPKPQSKQNTIIGE